eukprot:c18474_g1_i1.p1 GENE.c18474_g1_i1~~c18474_g1_i1.p1  ORF type:complete len:976 (-),score=328.03 c18474_g1_i1:573-3500(-)
MTLGKLFVLAIIAASCEALVIGIDLGARYFKVGLLQAGKPYHIILNAESKRRTSTSVGFVGADERLFGDSAYALATRSAEGSVSLVTPLLGRGASEDSLYWVKDSLLPLNWTIGERGTYVLTLKDGTVYSAEEIVAMILQYAQELASDAAGVVVKDAVIAVPPFFTQQQRQAILDAAQIAGITVTGLINDNIAVALLYGVEKERVFKDEEPRDVVLFDMGATATRVTCVRYGTTTSKLDKKSNKTVGEYWVKGAAWDATLGALAFDNVIMNLIATAFNEKNKVADGSPADVRNNPRAVAKMRKAAEKAKEVLSTISSTGVSIEGLVDDTDFFMTLSKETFDAKSAHLLARILEPVRSALAAAEFDVAAVHSIEVVGGGARIPAVQEVLKKFFNKEISMSLNGDDAVGLGTTLYGAKVSPSHRMREFVLRDVNPYPINVRVQNKGTGSEAVEATATGDGEVVEDNGVIARELFAFNSKMPISKRLSFSRTGDFEVFLDYASTATLPSGTSSSIKHFVVSGVSAALERYANDIVVGGEAEGEKKEDDKEANDDAGEDEAPEGKRAKVSISLQLTSSGLVDMPRYDASITVRVPVETPKPEAKEGEKAEEDSEGDNKDNKDQGEEGADGETAAKNEEKDDEKNDEKNEGEEDKEQAKEGDEAPKTTIRTKHIKLTVATKPGKGPTPLTLVEVTNSRQVLADLLKADMKRKEVEAAKNELETHIYNMRDFLSSAERIDLVCSEEEGDKIRSELTDAEDWLLGDGAATGLEEYRAKLVEVQSASTGVRFRHSEMLKRPEVLELARERTKQILSKLADFEKTKPWLNVTIKGTVLNSTIAFEAWLDKTEKDQAELSLQVDPVLTTSDVMRKLSNIDRAFKKLAKTPKPKVKKPVNATKFGNFSFPDDFEFDFEKFKNFKNFSADQEEEEEGEEPAGGEGENERGQEGNDKGEESEGNKGAEKEEQGEDEAGRGNKGPKTEL